MELGHLREQGGPVQRPAVPPAGGLHQRSEVGFRDVQPREPHDAGLALSDLHGRQGQTSSWGQDNGLASTSLWGEQAAPQIQAEGRFKEKTTAAQSPASSFLILLPEEAQGPRATKEKTGTFDYIKNKSFSVDKTL